MKIPFIIMNCILCINACMAQNLRYEGKPPGSNEQKKISPLRVQPHAYSPVYNDNLEDLCQKYQNIKIAGIVMTLVGGGVMTAGIVIHVKTNHQNPTEETYAAKKNDMLHNGGDAAIVLGSLTTAVGLPMIAIGSIKYKRTCGDYRRSDFVMQGDENGLGVAVKF